MREILFRGKRIDNGEWVSSGNLITFNDEGEGKQFFIPQMNAKCTCTHDEQDNIISFDSGMFYKVDPKTVGQFTGLNDKNGRKIFEGDIVKNGDYTMIVVWYDFHAAFMLAFSVDGNYFEAISNSHIYLEVIGNIHDNPELLGDDVNG